MAQSAGGLRIPEACRRRPEDIDSKRMVVHVRTDKGGRDRYTVPSDSERFLALLRKARTDESRRTDCGRLPLA